MKMSTLFPSKYLKAGDLEGREITVAIDKVALEEMGQGAQKEKKPVLYFLKATKGLVLNRTNAMIIAELYGDESSDWRGKRITLYSVVVRAFGDSTDAVRVKAPPAPGKTPPAPTTASTAPVEEPNGFDDHEDFTDADEPDGTAGNPWDDPAVGASAKSPPPPPAATKGKASQSQIERILILSSDLYGTAIDEARLAEEVSTGSVSQFKNLLPNEADVLLAHLEKLVIEKLEREAA